MAMLDPAGLPVLCNLVPMNAATVQRGHRARAWLQPWTDWFRMSSDPRHQRGIHAGFCCWLPSQVPAADPMVDEYSMVAGNTLHLHVIGK